MIAATGIRCTNCGQTYPLGAAPLICETCGDREVGPVRIIVGLAEIVYDYDRITVSHEEITNRTSRTMWRFREFLPVADPAHIVSLGEGGTPLTRCRHLEALWGASNLYLKNETVNPTGAFKDRESSVVLSMAKELGIETVTIASSGNAACSLVAYANAAGVDVMCLVPTRFHSAGKRASLAAMAPQSIGINAHYEDVCNLSIELGRRHGWWLAHAGANPYRMEGDKTIAYEICMDLGWQAPDCVVIPVGGGGDLAGQWKGYKELYRLGWIDSLPRLVAAQAQAGAPLMDAVLRGNGKIEPCLDIGDSIADGVLSKWPDYGYLALQAVQESQGTAVAVSEDEIIAAGKLLARQEGVFVEPSSAVAVAGYKKLLDQGEIDRDERVVLIGSATGLKHPDAVLEEFHFPLELEYGPETLATIEEYLKNR